MRSLKFLLIFLGLPLLFLAGCYNKLGRAEITLKNGDKLKCEKLAQDMTKLYCRNQNDVITLSLTTVQKIEIVSE